MAIITDGAREHALELVGYRAVRQLERAGIGFRLTEPVRVRSYPRRRNRVRAVGWWALGFCLAALLALAVGRLAVAGFQFLRS